MSLPSWRGNAAAIAGLACIVVAATFPIAFTPFAGTITEPEVDLFCHLWDMWWGWWTLFARQGSFFFTDTLHYPPGLPTTDFLSGPLLFVVAGAVQSLVGDLKATYNIVILLSMLCSCVGGYVAGLRLVKSRSAAFLVASVVAFNPMVMLQIRFGLFEFVNLGFAMLFLGSLERLRERMDVRSVLLSLLWFIAAATWAWYMGPLLVLLTVAYLLFTFDLRGLLSSGLRRAALLLVWAATLGAIVVFSMTVTSTASTGRVIRRAEAELVRQLGGRSMHLISDDNDGLRDLVKKSGIDSPLPSFEVKVASSLDPIMALKAWGRFTPGSATFVLRWLVPLLLAAVAFVLARNRMVWACGTVMVFTLLVSLGPCLIMNGIVFLDTYGWTPYGLLARFAPGMGRMQFPNRMMLLSGIALAVLSGIGLRSLMDRLKWSERRGALAALVAALLTVAGGVSLLEYPLRPAKLDVPDFYKMLAKSKTDSAVLNIPFVHGREVTRRASLARWAYYQTVHHKRDYSGPVPVIFQHAKRPPEIANNLLLLQIAQLTDGAVLPLPALYELVSALDVLTKYRFRHIVLHENDLTPSAFSAIKRVLDEILEPPERDFSLGTHPDVGDPLLVYNLPVPSEAKGVPAQGGSTSGGAR